MIEFSDKKPTSKRQTGYLALSPTPGVPEAVGEVPGWLHSCADAQAQVEAIDLGAGTRYEPTWHSKPESEIAAALRFSTEYVGAPWHGISASAQPGHRPSERTALTSHYRRELDALPRTYRACLDWNVDCLTRVLEEAGAGPLITVGSGGSFSAAVFCTALHELYTHQLAKAVTPLQVASATGRLDAGVLCLSASGRNRDICTAFSVAAALETRPLAAICLTEGSPLKALQVDFSYVDVVEAAVDIAPDGFLAVNSLFAMCVLLTRAYRLASGVRDALPASYEALIAQTDALERLTIERKWWIENLTGRTVSLLYSPPLQAAAADLESRFVEGALGNIHAADWRNFGHGRHHWLAKRASDTTVIAMIGAADQKLAARTLDLLSVPPTHSVRFDGAADVQGILAMLFALHLADLAGEAAGIDPGRPGVPNFGRKLYKLAPSSDRLRRA
jgi:fructoselysine-6-P-deglycase FrlB-like protein